MLGLSDIVTIPGGDCSILTFDLMLQLILVIADRQAVNGSFLHALALLALKDMRLQLCRICFYQLPVDSVPL
ncbi:hypothetical protein D3C76_1760120 [compost metagenome]